MGAPLVRARRFERTPVYLPKKKFGKIWMIAVALLGSPRLLPCYALERPQVTEVGRVLDLAFWDRFEEFHSRCKIVSKEEGLVRFDRNGAQRWFLSEIRTGLEAGRHDFKALKARQLGVTTECVEFDVFWLQEFPGTQGAFVIHDAGALEKFRITLRNFLTSLPRGYKIGVQRENSKMLALENGSTLAYLVTGTRSKRSSLGRSGAFSYLHASECAYYGSEEDIKELEATLAEKNPDRLFIWESTANGPNFWQEMWEGGKRSASTLSMFIGWWRNEEYCWGDGTPEYEMYAPHDMRLSKDEGRMVRAVEKEFGVSLSPGQIAWYRWKLEEKLGGDKDKMAEQYPSTPEEAFVATGSQYFGNHALTLGMRRKVCRIYQPWRYTFGGRFLETELLPSPQRPDLKIWEEWRESGVYILGCDPAFGSSDEADRTVITVYRGFADRCVQVAEFVSPIVSTYQCAWVLAHLAGYYRSVHVILEITGPGQSVFHELKALRIQFANGQVPIDDEGNVGKVSNFMGGVTDYLYRRQDSMAGQMAYHWKSTGEAKMRLMSTFQSEFELGRCVVNSLACIDEMRGVRIDDGYIGAAGRDKDDRVIASALACMAWKEQVQQRLINRGMTYERVYRQDPKPQVPLEKLVTGQVLNYLRNASISKIDEKGKVVPLRPISSVRGPDGKERRLAAAIKEEGAK